MLDSEWLKTSVSTVLSDEWRQSGRPAPARQPAAAGAVCAQCGAPQEGGDYQACGGTGRIQAGTPSRARP